MKTIIFFALLVASANCQQSAFESFMSRNRELFPNLSTGSSQFATSGQQQQAQPQIQNQWQQPSPVARSNQLPSLPSNEPFVTSNSHIQSFNQPQSFNQQQSFNQPQSFNQQQSFNQPQSFNQEQAFAQPQAFNQLQAPTGQTTTISGPNFQTSINLPAIPSLPQHATQSAPQQQQQPQFQNQFTSHIHSHQIPSSSAPLVNQQSTGLASTSFFNTQGNNFPSNFAAPAAPSSLPTPPQTFGPLDFSSFQGNSFFNNQQQRAASPSTPSSQFAPTNSIRAPGFETFVYMRPSEQPVQGASLRKVIRSPNGVDKELFYVPMPSYSPPSIYTTQVIHGNENKQGQQQ